MGPPRRYLPRVIIQSCIFEANRYPFLYALHLAPAILIRAPYLWISNWESLTVNFTSLLLCPNFTLKGAKHNNNVRKHPVAWPVPSRQCVSRREEYCNSIQKYRNPEIDAFLFLLFLPFLPFLPFLLFF